MNFKNAILAGLLVISTLPACSDGDESGSILREGLRLFYNSNYDAAGPVFKEYIAKFPEDPKGYWRELINEYFRLRHDKNNDTPVLVASEYQAFTLLAGTTITHANAKIERREDIDFNRYLKASTMSFLALLQYKNESIFTALDTVKEAVHDAEQSLDQNAGFLLGSINYKASQHRIAAKFAGIPHNRDKGRAMIFEAAAKNHSPFVDDIWFFVLAIERENPDPHANIEVQRIGKYLYKKYSDNPLLKDFR